MIKGTRIAVAVGAATVATLIATPAWADTAGTVKAKKGVNVRSAPWRDGKKVSYLKTGEAVVIECRVHGAWFEGMVRNTSLWNKLSDGTFISDAYVLSAAPVPYCDSETSSVTKFKTGATYTGSGSAVVASARKYLGVPYVFGSTNPDVGLDCSSLVQRTYRDLGVRLPRLVRHQRYSGVPVASLEDAKAGDLLIFDGYAHIGIYVGNGRMIAAPQPGENVQEQDVYETPTSIRRVAVNKKKV